MCTRDDFTANKDLGALGNGVVNVSNDFFDSTSMDEWAMSPIIIEVNLNDSKGGVKGAEGKCTLTCPLPDRCPL